jgi:hypothetical protein
MMNKIIKNIQVFFLWLAWLIIIAHLVVPHDHHLADLFSNHSDSCPLSNGRASHSPAFPFHCHAFNDLSSEKATIFIITHNIQNNDVVISTIFNSFVFELQFSGKAIFDIREPVICSDVPELSSLRAPPSLT